MWILWILLGLAAAVFLFRLTNRWKYFIDKPFNPLGFHDRILWKKPIMEDNGLYVGDEEEDEWFRWDEQKIKDKPLLEQPGIIPSLGNENIISAFGAFLAGCIKMSVVEYEKAKQEQYEGRSDDAE